MYSCVVDIDVEQSYDYEFSVKNKLTDRNFYQSTFSCMELDVYIRRISTNQNFHAWNFKFIVL